MDAPTTGEPRRNSFDVIRLGAAVLVAYGHQVEFRGYPEPALGPLRISLSNVGLFCFFALSGYLVLQSLARDSRLLRFAAARVLRIYPGAMVNAVVCVTVGSAITSTAAALYWRSPSTWSYLAHNLTVVVTPTRLVLPGVFDGARWPDVNTPIWTLKYELLFYALMFGLYRIGAFRRRILAALLCLIAGLAATLAVYLALDLQPPADVFYTRYNVFNFVRFGLIFAFGAYLAAIEGHDAKWRLGPVLVCIALVTLSPADAISRVGLIALFAFLAVEVGRSSLFFSQSYRRMGDFSFGVYLYAYPIGQAMSLWVGQSLSFWPETVLVFACAFLAAALSWYVIERPAQRMRTWFR